MAISGAAPARTPGRSAAFVTRAEKSIRGLQEAGLADPALDPRYAAHALTGMVSRFAYTWCTQ
ncbi:MAG TPA: hypothetical protein VIF35_23955, partial [Streptosporangiaceae bacterium]